MSSVLDIITDALKNCAVLSGIETPTADQAADGLRAVNRMLDSWSTERSNIYTSVISVYNLVPSQISYQIGPTATDFVAPRPIRIDHANIILNYNSPPIRVPLDLLSDDEWSAIKLQQVPSTIPQKLYNDGAFPNATLFLWGQAIAGLQLELYTWAPIGALVNLTDTFSMPPGYEEAIVYSLAMRLAPMFGPASLAQLPALTQLAQAAKSRIQSLNSQAQIMTADGAVLNGGGGQGAFNIFTGQ